MKRALAIHHKRDEEIERLVYWLLRSYIALRRNSWEPGPTELEVGEAINKVLFEYEFCGHQSCSCFPYKRNGEALLAKYDKKDWKKQ